ncbi:MAG: hypothetical protein COX62_02475 [Deltaproteobacteria bacterium CG_4_10_14_0_2_um_filter_43_8]|nr:MAG: hypothetical protein COV43_07040 [Deltaproteobacteria bacterium CG11_big_fil_rev_8_21_14_0_20_42_23]PJA21432.1 MAG: hypothetical protein COX62_02475 [Deltaproteobacteria bacterium CG_4_10_14_0_2_um_filter_43_8]PJC63859.1 MAG: hypothetical protein CO021_07225 [Deltaproteobacteria bacterium CG_4_9_14_0_2_um_filter_42_21]
MNFLQIKCYHRPVGIYVAGVVLLYFIFFLTFLFLKTAFLPSFEAWVFFHRLGYDIANVQLAWTSLLLAGLGVFAFIFLLKRSIKAYLLATSFFLTYLILTPFYASFIGSLHFFHVALAFFSLISLRKNRRFFDVYYNVSTKIK